MLVASIGLLAGGQSQDLMLAAQDTTANIATPIPVTVQFGSAKPNLTPSALRVGDDCLAPPAAIVTLGLGIVKPADKQQPLRLVSGGRVYPLETHRVEGHAYINLGLLVAQMGGQMDWDGNRLVAIIRARITAVTLSGNTVTVATSLPVKWRAMRLAEPERIVVDAVGVALPEEEPVVPLTANVKSIRFGAPEPEVARVVLEMKSVAKLNPSILGVAARQTVSWSMPAVSTPAQINTVELKLETDNKAVIRLTTDRRVNATTRQSPDPLKLNLDLKNVRVKASIFEEIVRSHNIVRRVRLEQAESPANTARLSVEVKRIAGVSILAKERELLIYVTLPRNATGKISEKLIVIDPGHGGADDGCNTRSYRSRTGGAIYTEQAITLAIGEKIAEKLADLGATVIMTRSEKARVGLAERPRIANEAKADFFLSIHVNSNAKPNSNSGSYIYYHTGNSSGSALANALQYEIGKASGLPNRGTLHDKTRFPQSGMAVLRLSLMPAVLIETAYLNHDKDRASLINPEWQDKIAAAIVNGVRRYLNDPAPTAPAKTEAAALETAGAP